MAATTPIDAASLMACHECDALVRERTLPPGASARCPRCGGVLQRGRRNHLDRTLAFTMAGIVLFVLANVQPFMTFRLEGREQESSLMTGSLELWGAGLQELGILVFLTSIGFPAFSLFGLLYVLLPLRLDREPPRHFGPVFRLLLAVGPWGMLEVYMLGVLVAIVKLSEMATLVPGVAFWSFCGLILATTAAASSLDPHNVWKRLGEAR